MKTFIFGLLALPLTLIAADTVKAAAKLEKATLAGGCFWQRLSSVGSLFRAASPFRREPPTDPHRRRSGCIPWKRGTTS